MVARLGHEAWPVNTVVDEPLESSRCLWRSVRAGALQEELGLGARQARGRVPMALKYGHRYFSRESVTGREPASEAFFLANSPSIRKPVLKVVWAFVTLST